MPSIQEEVKEVAEGMKRDFEEFKKENDRRLKLLEEKGTAGADREEKVNKISESLGKMEEKFEKLETVLSRAGSPADSAEAKTEQALLAKQAVKAISRGRKPEAKAMEAYLAEFPEGFKNLDEFKALSVDSDASGGFFVRPEISSQITKKIFESSPIRELASVITISSDAFEEAYDEDEPASGWVGERGTRSETATNEIKMIRIGTHELYAEPKATQKLLDDASFDVEGWHQGKVIDKFARDEATAFVSGDGVVKPTGITSYAAGDGFNKIEQVVSGSAGAVAADGLISLQNALLEGFQANALFLMRRATATEIRKLKDSQNRYLWSVDGDLKGGMLFSLLGKPVRYAADMPAVAANALSIAYGDFRMGYLVVDRIGIRVLRDPLTSKGFVKFYTTKRVGGGVRNFQAIKLQKLATS